MKKLMILRSIERLRQWYELEHPMLEIELDYLVDLLEDYSVWQPI